MIHIHISTSKSRQASPPPQPHTAQLVGAQADYYQIFQDGRPLAGLSFRTKREARQALRLLLEALVAQSYGWYRVEIRRDGAIGNILGIRKHYDDDAVIKSTFLVRRVRVASSLEYRSRPSG